MTAGHHYQRCCPSSLSQRLVATCLVCAMGIRLQFFNSQSPLWLPGGTANDRPANATTRPMNDHDDSSVKVFAPPSNSTSNVAICLILKNDTLYLDEWLDFHIALGFSPIYIYDNSPDFELNNTAFDHSGRSWFESRRDIRSHVRLIHFPHAPAQALAYDRCLKRDAFESTYVALIDVDEFLVLKTFDNVVTFMDEHCNITCGQLSINWQMMGTSGQQNYSRIPVTKRNVHTNGKRSGTIKVIVRPRYVAEEMHWRHSVMLKWGYWFDTNGTKILGKKNSHKPHDWHRQSNLDGPTDVAALYHYAFKSKEEFYVKKCIRGHSRPEGESQTSKCDDSGYYTLFEGREFDDRAWRQLKRMVPKYGAYDNEGEASDTNT
mmetsp:Transcript_23846/g.57504  ORF Transcript_23846/g.57504 Transcript_23846/m.57504 type:complete len:376 (-) Transcript_23846:496-1623(-)